MSQSRAISPLRERLFGLLEAIAQALTPMETEALIFTLRALPTATLADPSRAVFWLLRRLGASLRRADLDRALEESRGAPDAWDLQRRLLRAAFGIEATPSAEKGSRAELAALIEAFPQAEPSRAASLLEQMEALQPIGAPPWVIEEQSLRPDKARITRPDDLDQPPSALLRERLVALLSAPEPAQRIAAAARLLAFPDETIPDLLAAAYLRGHVDLPPSPRLAAPIARLAPEEIRRLAADDAAGPRLVRLLAELGRADLRRLAPLLIERWAQGQRETQQGIVRALHKLSPDEILLSIAEHLRCGEWGYVELLPGPVQRSPEALSLLGRAREEGRTFVEQWLKVAPSGIRSPGDAEEDARAVDALRERRAALRAEAPEPTRADLFARARGGDPEQARKALTALGARPDEQVVALLLDVIRHRSPRVRLHAHRLLRGAAERDVYLEATATLLYDPLPDVRMSAIRILTFARYPAVVPAIVELLSASHNGVRRAAAEGLVLLGEAAVRELRRAERAARPDRRAIYEEVLARIERA